MDHLATPGSWREGAKAYLELYSALYHTGETPTQYAMTARRFERFIGGKPLGAITKLDLQRYMIQRRNVDGCANPTVNGEIARLRAMFQWLVEEAQAISANPCRGLRPLEWIERDFSELDFERVARFLVWLDEYAPRFYRLYMVILNSGGRVGETLRLRGVDVDLARRRLRYVNTKKKRIEFVGITEDLVPVLRELKREAGAGPLFPNNEGRTYRRRSVTHAFEKLKARAGCPDLTLGFGRHIFGTKNAEVMPELALAKAMRLRNPATAHRYYVHLQAVMPAGIGKRLLRPRRR